MPNYAPDKPVDAPRWSRKGQIAIFWKNSSCNLGQKYWHKFEFFADKCEP